MTGRKLSPELLELIAERFKALAEPARLQLLNVLREGEKSVSELIEETGLGQANISKHLQLLHSVGFVSRRKRGLFVFYRLADDRVDQLCDLVCSGLEEQQSARMELLRRL